MVGVLETVRASHPASLWMLREQNPPDIVVPTGGIPATTGLVFGEGSLAEIYTPYVAPPAGPMWEDWSWGGTRDWSHSTTIDRPFDLDGGPYVQQHTIGPYGLQWDITAPGDGNNTLRLHTETPYDTTLDSAFVCYIKKPAFAEGLRFQFLDAAYAVLGNAITLSQITGTITDQTGRISTDTTKAFVPASLVGHQMRITGGAGAGLTQPIFANTVNTITPRFFWDLPLDTTSTYAIDPFLDPSGGANFATMMVLPFTLRGTTIAGTLGNFNLPSGALVTKIEVISIGPSVQTIYLDEMQFLRQRTRNLPYLGATTRAEIRSSNTIYNYAPQFLTRWPTVRSDVFQDTYANRMDGNAAGTTTEILEDRSLKWFGDIDAAYQAAGGPGTLADLAKAISPNETQWHQTIQQGWEPWGDYSGLTQTTIKTLGTFGIGQTKVNVWPYYPHARLSVGWACEAHMAVLRFIYDGAYPPVPVAGLNVVQKIRRAVGYWVSGASGFEFSEYVCRVFGGTVNEPGNLYHGKFFVGRLMTKPWLTMTDGDEFPYEDP